MQCPKCEDGKIFKIAKIVDIGGTRVEKIKRNCPHCGGEGVLHEDQFWKCVWRDGDEEVGKLVREFGRLGLVIGEYSWALDDPGCPDLVARMEEVDQ